MQRGNTDIKSKSKTIVEIYDGRCPECGNMLTFAESSYYCPYCGFSQRDFMLEQELKKLKRC